MASRLFSSLFSSPDANLASPLRRDYRLDRRFWYSTVGFGTGDSLKLTRLGVHCWRHKTPKFHHNRMHFPLLELPFASPFWFWSILAVVGEEIIEITAAFSYKEKRWGAADVTKRTKGDVMQRRKDGELAKRGWWEKGGGWGGDYSGLDEESSLFCESQGVFWARQSNGSADGIQQILWYWTSRTLSSR